MQLDWHLPENTRIGRSATGAPFSSRMRACSQWAHVKEESGDALVNCLQHDPAWSIWKLGQWCSEEEHSHTPPLASQWYPYCCKEPAWNSQSLCQALYLCIGSWVPPGAWQCVDSCKMTKALMPLTGPHISQTGIKLRTLWLLCIRAFWFSVWFLNPALSGFMILISIDHCHIILFSTIYKTLIFCSVRSV